MGKVLLVHGAWHNANCWNAVADLLRQRGVAVETVTLAGNENGATAVNTTYEQIVTSLVQKAAEISGPFVLLGHSSAGHVIQHAAPHFNAQLEKIIFNNAWLLPHGLSQFDLVPPEISGLMRELASQDPRACIPMDENFARNVLINDASKDVQDALLDIFVPQPLAMMEHRADTAAFMQLDVPMAMLESKNDVSLPPGVYRKMFLDLKKGEQVVEIDGAHECLFSNPAVFAEGVLKLL